MSEQDTIRTASVLDSVAAATDILAPTILKGVIIRRPKLVRLAEALALDDRAVRRMQSLRSRYGSSPLRIRSPGRPRFLLLGARDVRRVLDQTPEPFSPASGEKRAALAHFEPKVSLVSSGPRRAVRREFNEQVLETQNRSHSLAGGFADIVDEEIGLLLKEARGRGRLDWPSFFDAWLRIVRRIVLGRNARDDQELTGIMDGLRSRANWAFFLNRDTERIGQFHQRLNAYLAARQEGSLAAKIGSRAGSEETAPSHQVAHWLFAFDPGGMATFRALALLATHEEAEHEARHEIASDRAWAPRSFLRATLLEALRLWPTTPAILRQTTKRVAWGDGVIPANSTIMIFAPFFHRDDETMAFAHRFSPELWLTGPAEDWPLVPFSGGQGICPAHNLVPMVSGMVLARLLAAGQFRLSLRNALHGHRRLPGTLDHYRLNFAFSPT